MDIKKFVLDTDQDNFDVFDSANAWKHLVFMIKKEIHLQPVTDAVSSEDK